jgi:hypothetical protein
LVIERAKTAQHREVEPRYRSLVAKSQKRIDDTPVKSNTQAFALDRRAEV